MSNGEDGEAIGAETPSAREWSQTTKVCEGTPDGENWEVETSSASSRKSNEISLLIHLHSVI